MTQEQLEKMEMWSRIQVHVEGWSRVGHGLDPSMDWIGLGGMTVTRFLISNRCCTVDAVSFN